MNRKFTVLLLAKKLFSGQKPPPHLGKREKAIDLSPEYSGNLETQNYKNNRILDCNDRKEKIPRLQTFCEIWDKIIVSLTIQKAHFNTLL